MHFWEYKRSIIMTNKTLIMMWRVLVPVVLVGCVVILLATAVSRRGPFQLAGRGGASRRIDCALDMGRFHCIEREWMRGTTPADSQIRLGYDRSAYLAWHGDDRRIVASHLTTLVIHPKEIWSRERYVGVRLAPFAFGAFVLTVA